MASAARELREDVGSILPAREVIEAAASETIEGREVAMAVKV